MESYIQALDDYFCAQYADYTKISAIEGYQMPEVVYVGADGNIQRHDSKIMRLCHQKNRDLVLQNFKNNLEDTNFTFNFRFRKFKERTRDRFKKETFAKKLPAVLERVHETVQSAGEKLEIQPKIWKQIVKGKVYPEKNTVIALALVTEMQVSDVNELFNVCGFTLSHDNVRDIIAEYLIKHAIFNKEMRNRCLAEYKITTLPLKD